MEKKQYPYVFVHGMLGFGESEAIHKVMPYFGFFAGNVLKDIRDQGMVALAPSVSSLGSAWDRACELYAQLVGRQVDYGKAHSKKYKHGRWGRVYTEALVPDWGELDEKGRIQKIHLIGHSFGGATIRLLSHLLTYGAPEEQEVTDASEISGLFTGGKGEWVQSLTTIAGPHDGTTIFAAMGIICPVIKLAGFTVLAELMGNSPFNKIYDMSLDQWGMTSDPRKKPHYSRLFRVDRMLKLYNTKDTLFYDLNLAGAAEVNERIEINPNAYHFSIATSNSTPTGNGNQRMLSSTLLPLIIFGNMMGKYKKDKDTGRELDPAWRESDGASVTVSALHPSDEPFVCYSETNGKYEKGVWNVMRVWHGDHMDVVGASVRAVLTPKVIMNFYKDIITRLENLD